MTTGTRPASGFRRGEALADARLTRGCCEFDSPHTWGCSCASWSSCCSASVSVAADQLDQHAMFSCRKTNASLEQSQETVACWPACNQLHTEIHSNKKYTIIHDSIREWAEPVTRRGPELEPEIDFPVSVQSSIF